MVHSLPDFNYTLSIKNKFAKALTLLIFWLIGSQWAYSQCSTLVWGDEFNNSSLDMTSWSYVTGNGCGGPSGCGFGNNELEYYTNSTNNVSVSGGNLVLTAMNQNNYLNSGSNYTSGKIITSGKHAFKYGRFEASIKIPSATAIWPAFWLLPEGGGWPNTGEVDIMETQNTNTSNVTQTLHFFCTPCGNHQYVYNTYNNGTNFASGYHLYAIDWSPGKIVFSIDNVVTKTYTPSSLSAVGAPTSDWPFDNGNFYIILNLAVGGSYTGNATPNPANFPQSMYVDYVHVYSTPTTLAITGPELPFVGDVATYTVNTSGASTTYNWSVPAGGTIQSGQGTNAITVKWNSTPGGNVSVTVDPDGAGSCASSTIALPVQVIAKTCAVLMDDYESNQYMSSIVGSGAYIGAVANPSKSGSNTSNTVGQYNRNGGAQYDILQINKFQVGNPDDFRAGIAKFTMDVRTSAPAGTPITIEFDKSSLLGQPYPTGRHSQYTATTGAPNTWTKLTFTFSSSPDNSLTGADVDRIQILFNPNSYTTDTYYFDNLTAQGTTPTTSAISGAATVCQNLVGATYSVTGFAGSTYNWTVPSGATIVSGQGTKSIQVNFGTTGGNITVTETSVRTCVGPTVTLPVTVTGSCSLVADFTATPLSTCAGNVITFTDATTGKLGTETYNWNFGSGASPATATGVGPIKVTYSTGGTKTVALTVSNVNGTNTNTKTNYITIATPPSTCIFADDYNDNTVKWIAPIPGSFSHSEAGTNWTISNSGYGEWDNFTYTLNNGTTASMLDFSCAAYKPILKIRAKASGNCMVRATLLDASGNAIDNVNNNFELTTTYQTFTFDFSTHFRNYYGAAPGPVDSTQIKQIQFYINPGYVSFPYTGTNGTYNTYFPGTVDIDWIGIGNNCNPPATGPTITSFTPACLSPSTAVTITGTNLTGATSVTFNGVGGTITSNTATQIVVTAPASLTVGAITVTTSGGTVTSSNYKVNPSTSAITGPASVCPSAIGVTYSVTSTAGSTYNWSVPSGATIATGSGTASITVNFGTTAGNVSVTETNSGGCVGTAQTKAVTINTVTTSAITGPASVCPNATAKVYSVTSTAGSTYNWSVPAGATVASGSGTASITVNFGTAAGNVTVTETNSGGCVGTGQTKAVTINTVSTSAITGSASVCPNATAVAYSVTSTAGSTYNWTVPTGATIASGSGAASITVNFGTAAGNVTVTETNSGGCVGTAQTKSVSINSVTTSAITGSASVCPNATAVAYSVTSTSGSTYNWSVPAGATIASGSGTASITVNFGTTAGSVTVTETNSGGCVGTAQSKAVTINSVTTSAISGPATVCSNATGITYSVTSTAGSTYAWTVPTGATIASGTNTSSITVNFGTSGGNVTVKETNSGGCVGTTQTKTVAIGTVTTSAITGSSSVCPNATGITYSVTSTAGSSYNWGVPAGATIASGQGTASILVNFGTTAGNVTVTETGSGGCVGAAQSKPVAINAVSTSAITGSVSVCSNATAVTYSVTSTAGSTYNWGVPTGATIASGQGTSSITVNFGTTAGNVTVTETNSGGCIGTAQTKSVAVNSVTTSAITGSSSVCPSATAITYSVTSTAGSTYSWIVPSGATIASGSGTASITVNFGTTSGNVTVTETNSGGCVGTAQTKAVTINAVTTSAISGAATVCSNATGVTYSVTSTAGSTYAWTVPTGATIASGLNTASITVNFGTSGGNVTVKETNSGGCVGTTQTKAVAIGAVTTSAITGSSSVCPNATGISYSVTSTAGSSYAWTVPSGATIASGNGTASISVNFGTTGGNVTVTETNGGCSGAAQSKAVSITPIPTPSITGTASVCPNATSVSYAVTNNAGSTYSWTVTGGATLSSGQGTSSIAVNFSSTNGNLTVTETNNGCSGTASKTVSIINVTTSAITGSASVCPSATAVTYSVTNTAGSSYAWTVPSGATVASGQGTSSITVNFGTTSGNVSVTETTGGGCVGAAQTKAVTINSVATSVISGAATVCPIATGVTYSVTPTAGSSYVWTVPAGATIASGSNTASITVNFGSTGGNVTVKETNSGGCVGTTQTKAVAIGTVTTSAITGSATVCKNASSVSYSVTSTPGSTYSWGVPAGATIASGQGTASITVNFGTTGGNITVTETNGGCVGAAQSKAVSIVTISTSAITGSASVCPNATAVAYSVTSTAGSSYTWTVPAGATIATGQGTASITINFGISSGNVTVTESNGGCSGAAQTKAVTINSVSTSAITGAASVCGNSTGVTYSVTSTAGSTYNWTIPSGATITSGQGSASIVVSFGTSSGSVSVTETTGTGCVGVAQTKAVSVNSVSTSAISGLTSACANSTGASYSVTFTSGSTYNWTVPSGATIASGLGTSSVTVNFGTSSGNITVTETSSSGCLGATQTKGISVNPIPVTSSITGSATPACGSTNVSYSVTTNAGSTYSWSVPSGSTIVSGQGTGAIQVNFGTTNGSISVTETNASGCSATKSLAITLSGCSLTADFTASANEICISNSVTFTDASSGATGSSTYNWNFGSGASPTTATGVGPHTVSYTTTGPKSITLTITDGASSTKTKNNLVTVDALPTTANAGADQNVTVNSTALIANAPTVGVGTWTVIAGNGSLNPSNSSTSVGNLALGVNTFRWTITNGVCSSFDDVSITYTQSSNSISGPDSVVANSTYTFTVSGSGPYNWTVPNGATIISGQGTNSVTVEFGPNASGAISVSDGVNTISKNVGVKTVSAIYKPFSSAVLFENYPNPFKDEMNLVVTSANSYKLNLKVMDTKGVVRYTLDEFYSNQPVQIGKDITQGVYFVQISNGEEVKVIRIVKVE
jgi:hypothetical protein